MRTALPADINFIDGLQKMHGHMVGWMPVKQLEANIAVGNVLLAETPDSKGPSGGLGYCIFKDTYMKRDDVGIIYQLNVLPIKQRNLVGATLVKAAFEKAAYGVRLFCCWCAQDIAANWFWESIGFVPLAFRTGSRSKQRIHIFWQKRTREGDEGPTTGGTPYWFPSMTTNGAVAEDRIVFPIPPGTHWRDAKPIVLPGVAQVTAEQVAAGRGSAKEKRPKPAQITTSRKMAIVRSQSKHLKGLPPGKAAIMHAGGLRYVERGDYVPEAEPAKPKRQSKPREKFDPKLLAGARELRDKFLEQVNSGLLLPAGNGKYDVCRQLEAAQTSLNNAPLLEAA